MRRGSGADISRMDAFEAACVALSDLNDRYSSTDFALNPKGTDELHAHLGLLPGTAPPAASAPNQSDGPIRSVDPEGDIDELKAQMTAARAQRQAAREAPNPSE